MPDPAKVTGRWGSFLEATRTLISNSAYFQTWTGTASAALALERIVLCSEAEENLTTPYAVVFTGDGLVVSNEATGQYFSKWPIGGSVMVRFVAEIDADYVTAEDSQGAVRKFMNDVQGHLDSGVDNSYNGVVEQMIAGLEAIGLQLSEIGPTDEPVPWRGVAVGDQRNLIMWEWQFTL